MYILSGGHLYLISLTELELLLPGLGLGLGCGHGPGAGFMPGGNLPSLILSHHLPPGLGLSVPGPAGGLGLSAPGPAGGACAPGNLSFQFGGGSFGFIGGNLPSHPGWPGIGLGLVPGKSGLPIGGGVGVFAFGKSPGFLSPGFTPGNACSGLGLGTKEFHFLPAPHAACLMRSIWYL